MKLTTLLFFLALLQVSANSFSQTRLNLKFEKESLETVFNKIEANSEYSIFYKNDLIQNSKEVTGDFKDASVSEILDQVLKTENLTYTVKNKLIMIVAKDAVNSELNGQQQKSVSGKVIDSTGAPLPGVSVVIKGTTNGTITDAEGRYTIPKLPAGSTLQYSFVGMKTQEISVGNKLEINVSMIEEAVGLDEVVAVGYGTQKKVNLSGAVAAVKGDVLENRPITNIGQGLQGIIPNLQVNQSNYAPGQGTSFNIRGYTSLNGGGPLILIDGVV